MFEWLFPKPGDATEEEKREYLKFRTNLLNIMTQVILYCDFKLEGN